MATEPKTKKEEIKLDQIKATAIMNAIENDSNFKLYSYRIITDEAFIKRQIDLAQQLLKAAK